MHYENCFRIFCRVFRSGEPADTEPFFEGHAFGDRLVFATSESVEALLQKIDPEDPPSGNFTAILRRPEGLVFTTDWLGMSQLYLYAANGVTIVSNNLTRTVSAVREATGKSASVNWPALHRAVAFSTPFTHATAYEGITCVPFNSYLIVNERGHRLKKRFSFSDISAERGDMALYKNLVERAASEISANAAAAVRSFTADRPVVTSLSGGIDSRVVLAALVATGLHKDIGHYTYGRAEDSREAAALRKFLGLTFYEMDKPYLLPIGKRFPRVFSEVCTQRAVNVSAFLPPRREVFINGGCGETFRGFYTKMLKEFDYLGSADPLLHLLKRRKRSPLLTRDATAAMQDAIRNEYQTIVDGSPMTRLDLLYPTFRNRFHFGLGGRSRAQSSLAVSPLSSPSALKASLLLPPEERAQNRVAYDLIGLLAPELQDFEVSGRPWSPLFANKESRPLPRAEVEGHNRSAAFREEETRAAVKLATSMLNRLVRNHRELANEVRGKGYRIKMVRENLAKSGEMDANEMLRHAQVIGAILETESKRKEPSPGSKHQIHGLFSSVMRWIKKYR